MFSRRSFLLSLVVLPFTSLMSWAAEKKTVTTTEADASKALVKPTDMMPKAMKYSEKAEKATARTDKKANCASCMHYSQAITADKKEIKVKGQPVGACALFDGGKGYVKAGGWCMSWFKAA